MKKIITLSVMLFVGIATFAQQKPTITPATPVTPNPEVQKPIDPNAPVMLLQDETIDYGDVVKNADGLRIFKFKNTGKSPLKLVNVQSSCGCTVPSYPKEDIMPGQSSQIEVKYNTANPGRFSKSITVTTNGNPEKVVLRIKGNVIDPDAPAPVEQPKSMLSNQK